MLNLKNISFIFLIVLGIIFVSFFYFGLNNHIAYSEDYNVPLAKIIMSGEFINLHSKNIYLYSPGASNSILSLFILIGLPNLFGLLSWIFLFLVCKKLGSAFGLNKYMSFIFAASFCTTMSVIRTIGDQSIDKWLCIWFMLSIIFLENPKKTWKFTLLIGFVLGMLVGTKYSGPFFFISILLVYAKSLVKFLNLRRLFVGGFIFTIVGLFWYIRNFIITGSPIYPGTIGFLKGISNFDQQNWMLWKIPFAYPAGLLPLLNSFVSEYMIWAGTGIVVIWFILNCYYKKQKIDDKIFKIFLLILTTAIASLFLPITPAYKIDLYHIVSDMRYIYSLVVLLMLSTFMIVDKYKKNYLLAIVALVNAIPVFSFITYQPKIFVFSILLIILFFPKREVLLKKIIKL